MTIKNIEDKIIEEAQAEALEIKKRAQAEASEISKQYSDKSKKEYDQLIKQAHKKADALKKSILVPARLDAKKELLKAKHEILDQLFQGVDLKKREASLEKVASQLFKN